MNGLANVNIELTSRCNNNCWMCGRRVRDKLYGKQNYGDMDFDMVRIIAPQIPEGIVVQFHNNGEGLLYPRFGEAVQLFDHCIPSIVTNGKLLVEKADEIIKNLCSLSVSIFERDTEADKQFEILGKFLELKGDKLPFVTLRFIGDVDRKRYKEFGLLEISRALHDPGGSVNYRREPMIPEVGICWDFMTRLSIDCYGDVSSCVRFDPEKELVLGNVKVHTLKELWYSDKRQWMKEMHCSGNRNKIHFCGEKCHFWGVPTGA